MLLIGQTLPNRDVRVGPFILNFRHNVAAPRIATVSLEPLGIDM
jgi:hypothetical protein